MWFLAYDLKALELDEQVFFEQRVRTDLHVGSSKKENERFELLWMSLRTKRLQTQVTVTVSFELID